MSTDEGRHEGRDAAGRVTAVKRCGGGKPGWPPRVSTAHAESERLAAAWLARRRGVAAASGGGVEGEGDA